ncbi:hypothetical protein ACJIZ3_006047 [Penstemon smallii]|uniref:J domain-containing protein n=1 Tax=Penstemon smallii TaxID=265156 RepID=A0ABD3S6P2_9LAMI
MKEENHEQEKSKLATQIYDISINREISCVHLHHRSPFIDWYLILKINENAELDAIRKQYHKLALLLHPDKNKHSKAETAFKLVSEAYFCLSNDARRAAFDSERKKNTSCSECNKNPYITNNNTTNIKISKSHQECSRYNRIKKRMNELRTKLKDEATIIEKCLIVKSSVRRTESPVFNPSDYYQYKGYPHHKKVENLRAGFMIGNRCISSPTKSESAVFGYRSENECFMPRSASMRGQ